MPYRLLVKLLYKGQNDRLGELFVWRRVSLPEVAKSLRCSNSRVIEALDWLQALGMISYHQTDKKELVIKVALPTDV